MRARRSSVKGRLNCATGGGPELCRQPDRMGAARTLHVIELESLMAGMWLESKEGDIHEVELRARPYLEAPRGVHAHAR